MGRHRVSWLDVAGRVLDARGLPVERIARAVEALSAAYRSAAPDAGYGREPVRLAYVAHVLPAHVCDLRRVLEVAVPDALGAERLRVLALGGGPGAETLALLDAITARHARGEEATLRALAVRRADRARGWDEVHAAVLEHGLAALRGRDPGLGKAWTVDADAPAVVADLAAPPPPPELLARAAESDLLTLANVLSEIVPRGTPALPAPFLESMAAIAAAAPAGARLLVVDRAGSPGLPARVDRLIETVTAARSGSAVSGPTRVSHRCGCAFPRSLAPLYSRVRLPTTKVEDRPVRNCDTLWACVRLGSA